MNSVYVLIFFTIICVESTKRLPSFVDQCFRGDSKELSQCLSRNVEKLRPKLKDGIPELFIPSLNPLMVPSAEIKSGDRFSCDLKNLKIYNVENSIVTSFNLELGDVKKYELTLENPCLNIETDFHVKGKLLVLQLDNDGTCIGNLTGVKVRTSGPLEMIVKHGKQHLLGKNGDINMTLHSTYFQFDNLFKNNKALNERTNQIFNENQKVFVDEFGPTIGNIIKTFLETILNRLYRKFPIDVLFPETK